MAISVVELRKVRCQKISHCDVVCGAQTGTSSYVVPEDHPIIGICIGTRGIRSGLIEESGHA